MLKIPQSRVIFIPYYFNVKILLNKLLISWSLHLYTIKIKVSKSVSKSFFFIWPSFKLRTSESSLSFNIGPSFSEEMCVKLWTMGREVWEGEGEFLMMQRGKWSGTGQVCSSTHYIAVQDFIPQYSWKQCLFSQLSQRSYPLSNDSLLNRNEIQSVTVSLL